MAPKPFSSPEFVVLGQSVMLSKVIESYFVLGRAPAGVNDGFRMRLQAAHDKLQGDIFPVCMKTCGENLKHPKDATLQLFKLVGINYSLV